MILGGNASSRLPGSFKTGPDAISPEETLIFDTIV